MRNLFLFRHNPNHDYMDVILLYNIIIYKFSVYYYINGLKMNKIKGGMNDCDIKTD